MRTDFDDSTWEFAKTDGLDVYPELRDENTFDGQWIWSQNGTDRAYCRKRISLGSCSSLINDKTNWSGAWQGELRIPLTSNISSYTISLETDTPVTSLKFWDG